MIVGLKVQDAPQKVHKAAAMMRKLMPHANMANLSLESNERSSAWYSFISLLDGLPSL